MRKKIILTSYARLFLLSLLVGLTSGLLAQALELLTGFVQEFFLRKASAEKILFFVLPLAGLSVIYLSRKYLFRGKKNKGITEIFNTLRYRKDHLPGFKVPSHFSNGFFTVAFGGSTGIEVSTVVATAAIGNFFFRKGSIANAHKEELICAGVAAGIGTLFANPFAGFLFALEVISRKRSFSVFFSCMVAILASWGLLSLFGHAPVFDLQIIKWNYSALPYMVGLSLLGGLVAVYFTRTVIYFKKLSKRLNNDLLKLIFGALLIGIGLFFFPQLYGDSYHAVHELLYNSENLSVMPLSGLLVLLVLLKPLAASITLAAGGDGGVFAPSIVSGAFLGILVALGCNYFFNTELIVVNFAIIGAAAVLSAAIHAPLTALFLACGIVNNGFVLFVPLAIGVFTAKFLAKSLCDYTVYTYQRKKKQTSLSGT
ncbi:MAG: chloride channel protein [Salinimicrobium sp.]